MATLTPPALANCGPAPAFTVGPPRVTATRAARERERQSDAGRHARKEVLRPIIVHAVPVDDQASGPSLTKVRKRKSQPAGEAGASLRGAPLDMTPKKAGKARR